MGRPNHLKRLPCGWVGARRGMGPGAYAAGLATIARFGAWVVRGAPGSRGLRRRANHYRPLRDLGCASLIWLWTGIQAAGICLTAIGRFLYPLVDLPAKGTVNG